MSEVSTHSVSLSTDPAIDAGSPAVTCEQLRSQNPGWAMSQGSFFFEGQGRVQETLVRMTRKLDELSIPYAVARGMALFSHRLALDEEHGTADGYFYLYTHDRILADKYDMLPEDELYLE